jgi:hypothetical protein
MKIVGIDFGVNATNVQVQVDTKECSYEDCDNPTLSNGIVTCQFNHIGIKGAKRGVTILVGGQRSNRVLFNYPSDDQGNLKNLPVGTQTVFETKNFSYEIGLTLKPVNLVTVDLSAVSSTSEFSCTVSPSSLAFPVPDGNEVPKQQIVVRTSGNDVDEGTEAVLYSCTIHHTVASADTRYSIGERTVNVNILNEDSADVKLWTINPEDSSKYDYDVKFLPFSILEGGSDYYGIGVESEPKRPVVITPVVTLQSSDAVVAPPNVTVHPTSVVFNANNWKVQQQITLQSHQDDIDHNVLKFRVLHEISSEDSVFLNKATRQDILTMVSAQDDDTAGLICTPGTGELNVNEGSSIDVLMLALETLPRFPVFVNATLKGVPLEVTLKTSPPVQINPASWRAIDGVKFTVNTVPADYANYNTMKVELQCRSEDPAYNGLIKSFDLNVVDLDGQEPSTSIIQRPPAVSAQQSAIFGVQSLDAGVSKFMWRINSDAFTDHSCANMTSCSLDVPFIPYGKHRFEAKAAIVASTGYTYIDSTPAVYEWEISHCNDPLVLDGAETDTYAEIDKKGALQCHACPHSVGANCKHGDIQWDGIYANPGWWTDGTDKDTYYKCPFKGSCLGGKMQNSTLGNNSAPLASKHATKSRCEVGFTGVVCALCEKNYFMLANKCLECLPADGGAETVVAVTFAVAVLVFIAALLKALEVRDAKGNWKHLKRVTLDNNTPDKREEGGNFDSVGVGSSAGVMKSSASGRQSGPRAGNTCKTFIGFVQVSVVSESAFKIPWPHAFLSFLSFLSPFEFDFMSISGLGCLVEYNFFDSFTAMIVMPMVVLGLVIVTYFIGIARLRAKYKGKFTRAMRESYKNKAIQFTLWMILLMYPPISRRVLEYFGCSDSIDGVNYLTKDYRLECFNGTWNQWLPLAFLAVIVYPFGMPTLFSFKLWQNRSRLGSPRVSNRYGFLYEQYRPEVYWWDIFELLRKLFLTGIIVLIAPGQVFQVIVVAMANLAFLVILLTERPHLEGPERNLAALSYIAISFTMFMGLILKSVESAQNHETFFDVVLISINATVILYTIYVLAVPVILSYRASKGKKGKGATKVGVAKTGNQKKRDTVDTLFGKSPSHLGVAKKFELLALEKQSIKGAWNEVKGRISSPVQTKDMGDAVRKLLQEWLEKIETDGAAQRDGAASKTKAAEDFWEKPASP